jgi:hypothetical protein
MNFLRTTIALLFAFYITTSSVFGQTTNVPADLALVGARIYPSPSAAPIEDGTVLILRSPRISKRFKIKIRDV